MKRIGLIILAALMMLTLVSCVTEDNSDKTEAVTTTVINTTSDGLTTSDDITTTAGENPVELETDLLTLFAGGVSDYTVVRPDRAEQWETDAAVDLLEHFFELTGTRLPIATDWKGNEKLDTEILVGMTNRNGTDFELDTTALGRGGFIVCVKDERIVILGHDKSGIRAGVDYFMSLITEQYQAGEKILIEKDLFYMYEKDVSSWDGVGVLNYTDVKAMWLSQYDLNSVYGDSTQRDEESFRKMIDKILDNCSSIGINTVIVQVRPNADSMYPSEYYTPSAYVVGKYGNSFTYDPFAIIVEAAHERAISVQAWINPMRAMTTAEIELLDSKYQLKKWWDDDKNLRNKYLPTVSGRVYLNVGYPEVRQLIIDGAAEILAKYKVDGLHMDDYFYPTTEASFDSTAFSEYGAGKSLDVWRRSNLNELVSGLYSAVKAKDEKLMFGISPAGNMNTVYYEQYADVYTWCDKDGYIDYICPQIYFGMEHQTWAFDTTLENWSDIIKSDTVLWAGMTLGKAVKGSNRIDDQYAGTAGKNEWINNKDVLKRCLETTKTDKNCVGVAYFCYQYFWNPLTGEENSATKAERNNFLPLLETISWS